MSVSLAPFAGIPGISHPSGCSRDCRHPHLSQLSASRLIDRGIGVDLVREILDDELSRHEHKPGPAVLTAQGKLILLEWGAEPEEIEQIGGSSRAVSGSGDDYYTKARARAEKSREKAGPEAQRARNRDNAAAYRARKRAREGDSRQ